ncbi:MAG: tRNA (N(6)-L-threonylcarbamoyladenosine(37)-C(2))-methylthiotransferase MtaB [Bacteroidota bacterium]|nr:tRNA (N(6)-L-threonylcarbamoyladenosine(37)-C(2))-methylthiotransferase MtaB [Bacteroidota bacterium]
MSTLRTVAFHTLGCKLNFSETSSISKLFRNAGYEQVTFEQPADIYVINTCSVTDHADKKCRHVVRSSLRRNPAAQIMVIGCYAQLKPKEISEIPGVSVILGAAEKFNIINHIPSVNNFEVKGKQMVGGIDDVRHFIPSYSIEDRTRTFLKVQDGCDYKCTFCTIPLARGKSRSGTIEEIVKLAYEIGNQNVKEVVLTGVNIGDFGNGTDVIEGLKAKKQSLFIDLIKALDKVDNIERFRISSIEPNLCNSEIIEFVASSDKFMPHFHMPLQSGNNEILAGMKRRYKRELYQERVNQIKNKISNACIGVDVITGFPGETDEQFLDTYEFLRDLDISYLHVFTYSERPNTPAAEMSDKVGVSIRNERTAMLRILSEKKRRAFYESQIGKKRSVLVEKETNQDSLVGFTDNYIKVQLDYKPELINNIVNVQLVDFTRKGDIYAIPIDTFILQKNKPAEISQ